MRYDMEGKRILYKIYSPAIHKRFVMIIDL